MAFSQSIRSAQTPISKLCDLCEKDININWKCLQCKTSMCNTCKNIHLKVQTSIQHEIVNIKARDDVYAGGWRDNTTVNLRCHIHANKIYCMFCRYCDALVCSDCISNSHPNHDLESIDHACQEMKAKLRRSRNDIATKFTICRTEREKVYVTEAEREFAHRKTLEKIDKREKELKDEIGKYANELRQKVEIEKEQTKITLSEIEKRIKMSENTLKDKDTQIKNAIESNQAGQILIAASVCIENFPDLSFNTLSNSILDFFPGEEYVKNSFGNLNPIEMPWPFSFELRNCYTIDLYSIDRLVLDGTEKAWVSNTAAEVLHQVEIDNNMEIIQRIPSHVVDMTATSRNGVILTLNGSSRVMRVNASGEMEHFLSILPLLAESIHVTKDDVIVLGVREKGYPFKVTKESCRAIVIFGHDRQVECLYEYDKNNQRLFTVPYRITTNINK